MLHIQSYDEFVNESYKRASLRSPRTIAKKLKTNPTITPKKIYTLLKNELVNYIYQGDNGSEYYDVFFTPGFLPDTRKSEETLINKTKEVIKTLLQDSDIKAMYDKGAALEDEERDERNKQLELKRKKDLENKAKAKRKFLSKIKGAEEIYRYLNLKSWMSRVSPWMMPKTQWKESPSVSSDDLVKGKYYVSISSATYYTRGRGNGLLFGSIIQYLGNGKSKIIIEHGMYGPSIWVNVHDKDLIVDKISGVFMELGEFYKKNKSNINKASEDILKYQENDPDAKPLNWDPNWGMN